MWSSTPSAGAAGVGPASAAASRRIGGRRFPLSSRRKAQLAALFLPAIKAFGLGYIMDILPAIIKALLRFASSELKRIRAQRNRLSEERKLLLEQAEPLDQRGSVDPALRRSKLVESLRLAAPMLRRLPVLLQAVLKALLVALGPQGMALSCFWAMAGWKLSESLLWWPVAKYYALKLSSGASADRKQLILTRARIGATFISASLSSALSLMMLQHQSHLAAAAAAAAKKRGHGLTLPSKPTSNDTLSIDTTSSWIPKPLRSPRFGFAPNRSPAKIPRFASLAPAGHFLSRLTSLTVPPSPAAGRSMSGSSPVGGPGQAGLTPVSPDERVPPSPTDPRGTFSIPQITIDKEEDRLQQQQQQQQQQPPQDRAADDGRLGKPSATIDLTLFALVRGLDTLVRAVPLLVSSSATATKLASKETARPSRRSALSRLGAALSDQAEGLVFVVCCAQIMWAWFYHQERLPPTYVKWITNLATMDERLLLALRGMRYGKPIPWRYADGEMTPASIELVSSLAEQLGYPYEWGDPTRIPNTSAEAQQMLQAAKAHNARLRAQGTPVPPVDPLRRGRDGGEPGFLFAGACGPRGRGEMGGLPCEIIHCGTGGGNCYKNAALRWIRGWRMSMAIYFPVHLLPRLLFNPRGFLRDPMRNLGKVVLGAARSAAFLATYIVGNWFPICLARTEILPRLFPSVPFRFWDSGLGPALGSVACGFSIFIEEKRKRAEMALYVAPRALFAVAESLKSGWLSEGQKSALWAERLIFGMAVGTVVSAGRYRPDLLRGITGAMGWVVRPPGAVPAQRNAYARSRQ